jgi:transcriptional repressor NrdR|nr:MAG TPA: putative transcriptional regulator [Caudoviricetes sp.]
MKCKKCGGKTQVTDSEESLDGFVVMRRRQCPVCGNKIKTFEEVWESTRPYVKKNKGGENIERRRR